MSHKQIFTSRTAWWTCAATLQNEFTKMVWRPASMVLTGLMVLAGSSMFGNKWWESLNTPGTNFALPEAWPEILGAQLARPGLIFASLLILLLTASEYSWRTARQNVIDGLSKAAWFGGKIWLLVLVGGLFLLLQVILGVGFAAAGTSAWHFEMFLPGSRALLAMGEILMAYLGYGCLALFVAVTVRSPGPAVGVWFLYLAAGERLIATLHQAVGAPLGEAIGYLPINLFNSLVEFKSSEPVILAISAGWIILFIGVSQTINEKRDL